MLNLSKLYEDKRGEIFLLKGDLKDHEEITLFTTKKTFARGGCIHEFNDESCVVLEGAIKYYIGNNEPKILHKGQSIIIPHNTPHYFQSITDSLVVEWGATPKEKKHKHESLRKIVDDINNRID